MQVCLHHHMGTGIQTSEEIDKFMSLVDDKVFLLYDTGHARYSEGAKRRCWRSSRNTCRVSTTCT